MKNKITKVKGLPYMNIEMYKSLCEVFEDNLLSRRYGALPLSGLSGHRVWIEGTEGQTLTTG